MSEIETGKKVNLSIVIPCYNEERTLKKCVEKVLEIADDQLAIELIIVDDCSQDKSLQIATELEKLHPKITVLRHNRNAGKGAALRTGFKEATGDYIAVQDADLEYDPCDLKKLIGPLVKNQADVVLGSRFLSVGAHRVLYFWHAVGNKFLTFLSNMFTDLNLTDMETCYKVFRREVIQKIEIQESRFGFEPEIVAKVSQMRLRIYEMGISYFGRTYEEGKKIGIKDGFRALYCIFRYNAHKSPLPVQFLLYLVIGGIAGIVNLACFLILYSLYFSIEFATPIAFLVAAFVNYILCIKILFRHTARWNSKTEIAMYLLVVSLAGVFDFIITKSLFISGMGAGISKMIASVSVLIINFYGRRFLVFSEAPSGPWKPRNM